MRKSSTRLTGAAIAALVLFLAPVFAPGAGPTNLAAMTAISPSHAESATLKQEPVTLMTSAGEVAIVAEIARTPEQKTKGLMFRKSLDDRAGMLFPYDRAQEITMWMKNTYIPLDMVFIRGDGTVHRIEAMTEPFSLATVASQGPVTAVLELNGGAAARLGLKAGDSVRHAVFTPLPPLSK